MSFVESEIEDSPNTINILLMGESGVGKSTFINSFANYIRCGTFDEARKSKTLMLIPTLITIYDAKLEDERCLTIGSDKNEKQDVGASATQGVRTYFFPIEGENLLIRLIDTPGIGDTNGVDQDNQNCEGILAYLAQLQKLNAICLLLKPTNERSNTMFSYCIRRILSQLHKSAADNVVFLFTNTKGNSYRAGSTLPILKALAEKVAAAPPRVKIPVSKENVFCLDNESFKHLLALEYGVEIEDITLRGCRDSWDVSCREIKRLINYVRTLNPHNVQQTVSVNRTRELILQLSKPMSDICQLLQDNIITLQFKEEDSNRANQTIEELKQNLYKPGTDLEIIKLDESATVCTNLSCVEAVKVGNTTKFNYKSRCHDPCLLGYVSYEIIGHWSLVTCSEMTRSWHPKCKHCNCSYKKHMTIFYDTKVVEKQFIDEDVQLNLLSEEKQRERIEEKIAEMKVEKKELEEELEFISNCAASFAYYLQNNAITSAYDDFKEYLHLSLERQKSLGNKANMNVVSSLKQLLDRHDNLIQVLAKNKGQFEGRVITEESICKDAEKLFTLKHSGAKIKQIFEARAACAKNGMKTTLKSIFTETIPKWFLGDSH